MPITDKEYDSFRTNLDYIIEDTENITNNILKKIMRDRGFHEKRQIIYDKDLKREVKTYIRHEPTEKQLTLAWEYVKSKSVKISDQTYLHFRTEKYKKHTVNRLIEKEIVYKNKKYRKGQFIPKDYEKNV